MVKVSKRVLDIRKNKVKCDYGSWKSDYYMRACLDFDNCLGCGAYKDFKKDAKEVIKEIKKDVKKGRHIRDVLEDFEEGLLLDLLTYFFNEFVFKKKVVEDA